MTEGSGEDDGDRDDAFAAVARAHDAYKAVFPALTHTRRRWYATRTEEDRAAMEQQQALAEALAAEFHAN